MTLKDISREAGVSVSTVSRILNCKMPNAASKAVVDRVWEIARSGGYVPNASAQSLKRGGAIKVPGKSIACIHMRSADIKKDAFFSSLMRSVEQELLPAGYRVKCCFTAADLQNPAVTGQFPDYELDGAAVLGRCDNDTLRFLKHHFRKIVYCGLNAIDPAYDQIICDGHALTLDVMKFLFGLGHRRIGYIGATQKEIRYDTYRTALQSQRIPFDRHMVTNAPASARGGYEGARRILSRVSGITAFFCMNDITAIGAIEAIREAGFRIPEDISVISIDDIDAAQQISPMLTSMHVPIEELGRMTAKILIDRINNGHRLPLRIFLPHYLVKRESCGPVSFSPAGI